MNKNVEKQKKILIVDDEKYILRVVKRNLLKYGYEVLTAQDGEESLEIVFKVQPDLILLDIMMPVMDGFEVFRKLKENETSSKIPVIFLTARGLASDKSKAKELGAEGYISKPFSISFLISTLQEKLGN